MRISRKRKKAEPTRYYEYNERIKSSAVLLLGENGENLGEINTGEAIRQAKEKEMDLVIINPKNDPPVAKIIDFGQFKYQKDKEDRIKKARQHVVDTKVVRTSLRIGAHDLDIRKKQAIKFLNQGNKVKIELVLRGREMQQTKRAFDTIREVVAEIGQEEKIKIEEEPKKQANRVAVTIVKT